MLSFQLFKKDRLYYLYKILAKENGKENLSVWHKILGHCNYQKVRKCWWRYWNC